MNKGESIIIEQVGNGYLVKPKQAEKTAICLDYVMVFQTTENLLGFINQHFAKVASVGSGGGGPVVPDGSGRYPSPGGTSSGLFDPSIKQYVVGSTGQGGQFSCPPGIGGGGLSPNDWAVKYRDNQEQEW